MVVLEDPLPPCTGNIRDWLRLRQEIPLAGYTGEMLAQLKRTRSRRLSACASCACACANCASASSSSSFAASPALTLFATTSRGAPVSPPVPANPVWRGFALPVEPALQQQAAAFVQRIAERNACLLDPGRAKLGVGAGLAGQADGALDPHFVFAIAMSSGRSALLGGQLERELVRPGFEPGTMRFLGLDAGLGRPDHRMVMQGPFDLYSRWQVG